MPYNYSLPFSEDFATATGSTPPLGWINNTITGSLTLDVWRFDNPGGRTLNAPVTNPAAIFDSDNYSSRRRGAENVALQSPLLDASGETEVILQFDHHFEAHDDSVGFVEVWDGMAWQTVYSSTTDTPNPEHQRIDISAYAAGVADTQVRFRWTGDYAWYWIVDNVRITGPLEEIYLPLILKD